MKNLISVSWEGLSMEPSKISELKRRMEWTESEMLGNMGYVMYMFEPLVGLINSFAYHKKIQIFKDPKVWRGGIILSSDPKEHSDKGFKDVTVELPFDLYSLIKFPNDPKVTGPFVVKTMQDALKKFQEKEDIDATLFHRAIRCFEENDYRVFQFT